MCLPIQYLCLVPCHQFRIVGRAEHGVFAVAVKTWRGGNVGRKLVATDSAHDERLEISVQVPLFVNQGDKVKVDTRTGEYLTRVGS